MKICFKLLLGLGLLGLAWFGEQSLLAAQITTGFAYQGRLDANGNPANGSYDLTFALFDDSTGTGQIGETLTNLATVVSNGLFIVKLDFGDSFSGDDRWLEISVRTNGDGAFTALAPRQQITPAPYAIAAGALTGALPSGQLSGEYSGAVSFSNPSNSFAGNGLNLTNIPVSGIAGQSETNAVLAVALGAVQDQLSSLHSSDLAVESLAADELVIPHQDQQIFRTNVFWLDANGALAVNSSVPVPLSASSNPILGLGNLSAISAWTTNQLFNGSYLYFTPSNNLAAVYWNLKPQTNLNYKITSWWLGTNEITDFRVFAQITGLQADGTQIGRGISGGSPFAYVAVGGLMQFSVTLTFDTAPTGFLALGHGCYTGSTQGPLWMLFPVKLETW